MDALALLQKEETFGKFNEILGKKTKWFITTLMTLVSQSDKLKTADPKSVYLAALTSATLDLPINQNLWFAYILPYGGAGWVKAQFQLWYKWFIQLALRSGQFKTISATPVYKGQMVSKDPLRGYVFDWEVEPKWKPIWYAGFFSLINGFEKTLYMSVEELESHGKKFSMTYKRGFGLWKDDFESMAIKTVIKLLLSKYAPLSVDMQKAITVDQAVINDEELVDVEYVDNTKEAPIDQEVLDEKLKDFKAV